MCNFYESLDFSKKENHIFDETENFIVIPSVGALVSGWLMVVPKKEFLSSLEYPDGIHQEYHYILNKTLSNIYKQYGTWTVFENGSVKHASIGCGVNYAHTHVLPLKFDLIKVVDKNLDNYSTIFKTNKPFIYIKNMISEKFYFVEDKESQFIRKLIARELHIEKEYDYSTYPFYINIDSTISALSHSFL
ncbi:hypothetical protein LJC59_02110 [Desulfovibrio sp. OttesenSCG-928-A18]|nr:hypothetical protein [Desulfovibrio sp. OttesenSCG-928-A18]